MDFHKEQQTRIERNTIKIGQLAYERVKLKRKIKEIDQAISDLEVSIMSCQQAQRDFNSYLAVKEGAVTIEQLKEGIQNGGQ
jgi:predicted RNase H-like nuclease (RuvC/YqgF family)